MASSEAIPLEQGEVHALRLVAQKAFEGGRAEHVVLYFYLWPSYGRDSQDGTVVVKVTAPIYGTTEETVALEKDFFRQLFKSARS